MKLGYSPRIPVVEAPSEEQAKLLARSLLGPDGEPLNVFRTLVRNPELMKRINALGGYFLVHSSIDTRQRELVILRTATTTASPYEIGQHRWLGIAGGLRETEIAAALDPATPYRWSADDAAVLRFVDELLARDTVCDATWESLSGHGDEGRLELLVLVGYYRLLAGVLNAAGIELDAAVAAATS